MNDRVKLEKEEFITWLQVTSAPVECLLANRSDLFIQLVCSCYYMYKKKKEKKRKTAQHRKVSNLLGNITLVWILLRTFRHFAHSLVRECYFDLITAVGLLIPPHSLTIYNSLWHFIESFCLCSEITEMFLLIFQPDRKEKDGTLNFISVPCALLFPIPFPLYFHPRSFQSAFPFVPAGSSCPPPLLPRFTFILSLTAIICSVFIVFPALIDYVWLLFLSQWLYLHTGNSVCVCVSEFLCKCAYLIAFRGNI